MYKEHKANDLEWSTSYVSYV